MHWRSTRQRSTRQRSTRQRSTPKRTARDRKRQVRDRWRERSWSQRTRGPHGGKVEGNRKVPPDTLPEGSSVLQPLLGIRRCRGEDEVMTADAAVDAQDPAGTPVSGSAALPGNPELSG